MSSENRINNTVTVEDTVHLISDEDWQTITNPNILTAYICDAKIPAISVNLAYEYYVSMMYILAKNDGIDIGSGVDCVSAKFIIHAMVSVFMVFGSFNASSMAKTVSFENLPNLSGLIWKL